MPVDFSYDPTTALLTKHFSGVVTDGDLLLDACVLTDDPRAGKYVLVDLGDVKRSDVSTKGMRQVIKADKAGGATPRPEHVAVVAPTAILYAMVRTYEGLAKAAGAPTRLRVFKTMDDARAWFAELQSGTADE